MMTSTVAITLDLGCCRCRTQIQKILCCLQERCGFAFEKVVYEMDKVLVSGSFDAVDLCCKLRCKAGCFATKIEIVPPPEQKKKEKDPPPTPTLVGNPKPETATGKALIPYPFPYPSSPFPNPQPTCPSCRPPPTLPCPPCNKCPTWTPCQCRGYPWVVCWDEKPDSSCAVM